MSRCHGELYQICETTTCMICRRQDWLAFRFNDSLKGPGANSPPLAEDGLLCGTRTDVNAKRFVK